MKENKMGEIAQRFGKKLGEYFKIKDDVNNSIYSFESCGVVWWQSGKNGNSLIIMDSVLADLITGRKEVMMNEKANNSAGTSDSGRSLCMWQ